MKNMRKLGFLLCLISFEAWGYRLTQDFRNGFYWQNLPIKITVMDGNASRKTLLEELSSQAIGEWQSRTGLALWNFRESGSNAVTSNIIRWSTKFAAETNMDPQTVLAVAIRYTEGPYFAKTEIVINGNHPEIKNNTANLLTTLTHELGHTMGLDHSEDWSAVMAPTLQSPYYGLASDDISGMDDAYQKTVNRQVTGYISPLASEETETSSSPLSCGTVSVGVPATGTNALASLSLGMLIGFVRKLLKLFKSWF
jgi:hypothetical protein